MTDLMPLQAENKIELLNAFRRIIPKCNETEELERFLMFLRSKNLDFESFNPDGKARLFQKYLDGYIGEKKFRVGRDG